MRRGGGAVWESRANNKASGFRFRVKAEVISTTDDALDVCRRRNLIRTGIG